MSSRKWKTSDPPWILPGSLPRKSSSIPSHRRLAEPSSEGGSPILCVTTFQQICRGYPIGERNVG